MKIRLAGYNVDLDHLKKLIGDRTFELTPETFSAAYARISRSPKPISELRKIARKEIAKAREQNRRVIFEMGHHSVAEHAVFNFDIMNISRLAVEYLESHRLMSYTEASQRYIRWHSQFIVPEEIKKTKFLKPFLKTIETQIQGYDVLSEKLKSFETKLTKPIEDARYVTSLAMTTQLGATMNARNLELVIRRCAASKINEVRMLGKKLFDCAVKIAPSILLFYQKTNYDSKTYDELKKSYQQIGKLSKAKSETNSICRLVDYTKDADEKLIAVLIHKTSNMSFPLAMRQTLSLNSNQKLEIVKTAFKYANFYDAALREFEHIYLTFELILSASCFAQLKRHRMATISTQDYDLNLGVTIPESIKLAKQLDLFNKIIEKTEKTYEKIHKELPHIAPYILTQAHRRRVLLTLNIRELYHIARLRMDQTAQWDIRELSRKMVEQAQKVMPISLAFCCAKDQYDTFYQKYFKESLCQEKQR
ncbi:MAG: FAD-dependent thymidylate synthase [candidate division WOR-3 bacterium]|nr:FAD-dependent thymidylate synthase [candidate division WOR-3 bacterium]